MLYLENKGLLHTQIGVGAILLLLPVMAVAEQSTDFDCLIEAHMEVELSTQVDGILEQVLLEPGDQVEPEQIVAKLKSGVVQATLDYAKARAGMTADISQQETNLGYGRRNEHRITELHQKNVVSMSEIDRVRTESALARFKLAAAKENKNLAELEMARAIENLNQHTIRSPIKGVVVERYLNPGESVEDQPIVKLAQIDPLQVVVVMPISQFGKIQRGQQAMVYPEAAFGGEYQSIVSNIDPVFHAASGTFRVRLALPNPEYRLTSGLKCRVQFDRTPVATSPVQDTSPTAHKVVQKKSDES